MSNSPLSILRFKVIFIICWLVIITDQAIALNFFGLPWQAAIIDSLICNALLLLACLLIMHTLRYYLPRGQQYINIFSICIFLSILWLILSKWLLKLSLGH
ncbi:MAG: sensor histidine kinase, partial [Chitinophagaceae bacterium]|nr:sensor histidine kinase [Chitinophagaceae bacterium]